MKQLSKRINLIFRSSVSLLNNVLSFWLIWWNISALHFHSSLTPSRKFIFLFFLDFQFGELSFLQLYKILFPTPVMQHIYLSCHSSVFLYFFLYCICYNISSALCFHFLAMRHIDLSSPTRDWIHTPCIGKWSLYHWTEVCQKSVSKRRVFSPALVYKFLEVSSE